MAKAAFGYSEGFNYAVKINGLDRQDFWVQIFGRRIDDLRRIGEWQKTAKTDYVRTKHTACLASLKRWIKATKPTEFYAKWRDDTFAKDDSVEVYYKIKN